MSVTNRKSMKLDFTTLCIEEKTILKIKNFLSLFFFPSQSLWFGTSLAGYQWVSWCGKKVGATMCAGGQLELGLGVHRVVWIWVAGVTCFLAGSFAALIDTQTQIWLFKAVFQGNEACSCHSLPARSHHIGAGAAIVQCGKRSCSTVCCLGGKLDGFWLFVLLFAPSLGPLCKERSSVCCLIVSIAINLCCESDLEN